VGQGQHFFFLRRISQSEIRKIAAKKEAAKARAGKKVVGCPEAEQNSLRGKNSPRPSRSEAPPPRPSRAEPRKKVFFSF